MNSAVRILQAYGSENRTLHDEDFFCDWFGGRYDNDSDLRVTVVMCLEPMSFSPTEFHRRCYDFVSYHLDIDQESEQNRMGFSK